MLNGAISNHTTITIRTAVRNLLVTEVGRRLAGRDRHNAASVLPAAGSMQAGLPAATTDGHVGASSGHEPTGHAICADAASDSMISL